MVVVAVGGGGERVVVVEEGEFGDVDGVEGKGSGSAIGEARALAVVEVGIGV